MSNITVNVTIVNSQLGLPQSNEGIFMLFVDNCTAVTTTFALETPYLLSQLSDLSTLGITSANNPELWFHISEFYAQAGSGRLQWICGLAISGAYTTFLANTVSPTFRELVESTAQADVNYQAKGVGLCYKIPTATQSSSDFPSDVLPAMAALQTQLANLFSDGFQLFGILDGANMSSTQTPLLLTDISATAKYRCALMITGSQGNGISSVGLALGTLANLSVGTSIGKVANGSLNVNSMYLTNGIKLYAATGLLVVGDTYTVVDAAVTYNGVTYPIGTSFIAVTGHTSFTGGNVILNSTPVQSLTTASISSLGNKQYLFIISNIKGFAGFYFNDDATAETDIYSLSNISANRISNQLAYDALVFMNFYRGSDLPVDATSGNLDAGFCSGTASQYYSQYVAPLKISGDIADASLTITGVNFNSTRTVNLQLNIVRNSTFKNANIIIQFVTSL